MNSILCLFKLNCGLKSLLDGLLYSAPVGSLWIKILIGCSSSSLAQFPNQAAWEPGLLSSAIAGLAHCSRVSGTSDDTARRVPGSGGQQR